MTDPVVIDTNILFSALLSRRSRFATALFSSKRDFYINELVLAELFRHKEKVVRLSKLRDDEIIQLYYRVLWRLTLFKEDLVTTENRRHAFDLCRGVDETDAPHVAITLELQGLLWTGDQTLRRGLQAKGFTRFFEP